MDVIVKSVARTYHWTPSQMAELYMDELDWYGLIYWYNDAKAQADEIKNA